MPQVVALTRAFADPGKHRIATVLGRHAANQFHDDDGLSHTGTAEDTGLATLHERSNQVDYFDAGLEELGFRHLIFERRGGTMDRIVFGCVHRTLLVDGPADDVENPPETCRPDRHLDRRTGRDRFHTTRETVGDVHRDAAHPVVAEMLLHLHDQFVVTGNGNAHGIVNLGQLPFRKLQINHRSDHLDHSTQ